MYKLYIDSSQRREKSVTLVKINGSVEQEVQKIEGDIDLVSSIETILRDQNLRTSDINMVIPNLGPGSFTGLKLGVTIANVINYLNKKKTLENLDIPNYGSEPNITLKEF